MSNQTVGERIRIVRKLNRLTGKELAEKIRVTEACISRLEHDAQNPSALLLHVMSLEFNISENWLLTGTGEMFMQADQKGNVRRQYDDKIMKLIEHVITKLEEVQEKMEIDRANSQPPKDDKTSYHKDILSSPATFCNPAQGIENLSNRTGFLQRREGGGKDLNDMEPQEARKDKAICSFILITLSKGHNNAMPVRLLTHHVIAAGLVLTPDTIGKHLAFLVSRSYIEFTDHKVSAYMAYEMDEIAKLTEAGAAKKAGRV